MKPEKSAGRTENAELHKLLLDNEQEANIQFIQLLSAVLVILFLLWIEMLLGIVQADNRLINAILIPGGVITLIVCAFCRMQEGKGRYIKYLLMVDSLLIITGVNILTGFKIWLSYALIFVIICRYGNIKLIAYASTFSILLIIGSAVINTFVSPGFGYMDLNTVAYSQNTVLNVTQTLYGAVTKSNMDSGLTLRNTLILSAVPNITLILLIATTAILVIRKEQEMMLEVNEIAMENAALQIEMQRNREKVLMSQIQPHFLYNALSAIMAIDGNPDETVEAIGEFGKYLRENLDSISGDSMNPIEKEMQHVKRYVALEQLRFGEKVRVQYDLQSSSFQIPVLSVQILAENAIKHGISKKPHGGTLTIATEEDETYYRVIVSDDGLGFDMSQPAKQQDPSRSHIGLTNLRERLDSFCGGTLTMESAPGEGTRAVILIPKKGVDNGNSGT